MAKRKLMMLGPPGAGKGTQAKLLSERLSIPHVSTGDMLREARRKGTPMGQEAARYMDGGQLVPDEVVIGIVRERLAEEDAQAGFILDGFPRTRPQAESLDAMGIVLEAVLNVRVSDDEVVRRLGGRLSCPACGRVYHEAFSPPTVSDTCDTCGHLGLIKREDDRPEAIRERLKGYWAQTNPLVEYYESKGVLVDVDGEREPVDVERQVVDAVQ
ncbi:MAG: adenylate kinase [Bradymonadaceae bacterium]|nr:adenylate kinase [Lujinxingiaceae bacterium]